MQRLITKAILLSFVAFFISGCFHEEDTDVETAQFEFVDQTLTVLEKTEVILNDVTEDLENEDFGMAVLSATTDAIAKSTASDQSKETMIAQLRSMVDWRTGLDTIVAKASGVQPVAKARSNVQARISHEDEEEFGITDDINQDDITDAFNEIFEPPTQDGNVITYKLRLDLCDDAPSSSERSDCREALGKLTVVLTVDSNSEGGTMEIMVENFTPITYSYSPTKIELNIDLADLKSSLEIIAAFDSEADVDDILPSTFEGDIGIFIELTSNDAMEMGLSINDRINIDGLVDSESIEFILDSLSNSNKVITLKADSGASTMGLELGVGLFSVSLMDNSGDNIDLSVPEFTGELSIDMTDDSIVISDFGVGGTSPILMQINGDDALSISMGKHDMELSGTTGKIEFTSAIDFNLEVNNVHEDMNSFFEDYGASDPTDSSLTATLEISAPSGLTLADGTNDEVEVEAGGPLTIVGGGFFNIDESVDTGECFTFDENSDGFGDGFQSGTCGSL